MAAKALSPDQIRDALRRIDAQYPYPQRETDRIRLRQWITACARRNGIGAEIGVFRGRFSEVLLKSLTPRRMYFVDPWRRLGDTFKAPDEYAWMTCNNTLPTEVALEEAMLRASLYPATQSTFIEDYFPGCAGEIPDRLDWIYIDSSHRYEATLAELKQADAMLAPGGVILGDDWDPNPAAPYYAVVRAVNDFVRQSGFEFVAAGPGFQWCIRRPPQHA
jgi:hypothetical protein